VIDHRTETRAASGSDRQTLRAEFGFGAEDLVILLVAPLEPAKDHATALRMLEHVVWHQRNARLCLVGEGPERGEIERVVEERNLAPFVRLLGRRQDLPRLFQAADLFLFTSLSEARPQVLLEAMAGGLPVVATQLEGVAEVVEDGLTGLLAPPGDDAALADCILRLARNPHLAQQMSRLGRERAQRCLADRPPPVQYPHLHRDVRST
jgi:glycosyltransferase involved in cell wall biosynthesis